MGFNKRILFALVISVEVHVLLLIQLAGQFGAVGGARSVAGFRMVELIQLGAKGAQARTVDEDTEWPLKTEPKTKLEPDKPAMFPALSEVSREAPHPGRSQARPVHERRASSDSDRSMPGSPGGSSGSAPAIDASSAPDPSPGGALPVSPSLPEPERAAARCANCPRPSYPAEAQEREIEGTVEITFLVLADGSVGDAYVSGSSGYPTLDETALAAVKQWTFFPATENGEPVSSRMTRSFDFRIPGR